MRLRCALVLFSLIAACTAEPKDVVENADVATTTTTASTGAESTGDLSTSSTGAGIDGDAYCAQFDNIDDCQGAFTPEVSCGWKNVTTFDTTCSVLDERGLCLWIPVDGTDPGCAPPPGCPADIWYREVDGGIETSAECGGSFPAGFEPCPGSGAADEPYAIAECNCACSGTGTSSGGDFGTSSSTGG